uniref:Putative ATPbinding transport protein n=1 Tax=termite gut metagenome TaxID=433724 RepID=S0DGC4_9ZZZZ
MKRASLEKTVVRQHDATDCGTACLLSLIRYYGGDSSIPHLREISGTSIQGTTLLGLYQAAGKMGFKAEGCEADMAALIEHGKPVILHILTEQKFEHYIVCYKYENGKFLIGDPAVGLSEYTPEELEKLWLSKKCLVLEPSENFVRKKDASTKKKTWIKNLVREDMPLLLTSIGIGIVVAGLGMVMAVFSQKLVDDVLPGRDTQKLLLGIIFVTFLLLVRTLIIALRQKLLLKQGKDFNNRIIDFFYDRLLNLPKPFFDTHKIGDMVARLNDTRRIQTVIATIAGNTMIDALVAVVSFGFLAYYSWQVGLIALLCMPVFFLVIYRHNARIIAQQKDVMMGYSLTESNFISTIDGIATIKNYNKQGAFQKINKLLYELFQQKIYNLGSTQIRIGILSGVIGTLILMGIINFSSWQVFQDRLSIGEMMAVIGIAGSLFPSIANLALIAIPINEAKVAFDRMFDIIGNSDISEVKAQDAHVTTVYVLKINNLGFRFTGRKKLLSNINMNFNKGGVYCVIGESGCGKSTLCQIMQRFYEPETGTMSINDIDANQIPIAVWNDIISVVPQDVFIYNGTVIENICFGQIPEDLSQIVEFCRKYGLDNFFDELPQGLMTIVGEEGINLSGGQKQLLALARALYKPFQILLLDETTSAMDRITETSVCEILNRIKSDKIVVFVTHRLQTARKIADFIYIIKNGSIETSGTHEQLMKTRNFYSEYWQ